jgi:hypothetical protein
MKKIKESLKREVQEIYRFISLRINLPNDMVIDFSNSDWENQFNKIVNLVGGAWIAQHCTLSKAFIDRYQDYFEWNDILIWQKLHKSFIKKYNDKINRYYYSLTTYQKRDEKFIIEYLLLNKLPNFPGSLPNVLQNFLKYQKVSKKFIEKYKLTIPETNWLYKTPKFIESYIKNNTGYEIYKDTGGKFIIAYKGILSDRYSVYTYQYRYLQYHTYTSHCDCNIDNENGFGLSAWTEEKAKDYCSDLVIRVKIYIKDIGCFVHGNNKIRCRKFTVLD